MKKLKQFNTNIWFKDIYFDGNEVVKLHTSDEYNKEMITSPIQRIEFKGHKAIEGYTIEVETKNTVYILTDLEKDKYFYLMKNCPEEFRGPEWIGGVA